MADRRQNPGALRDAFRRYTAPVSNGDDPKEPRPLAKTAPADRALVRRAQETRERVIARLSDHFAQDTLDVDEFERRVTVAQTSDNPTDIEALLADLPDAGGAPAPTTAIVPTVVQPLVGQDRDLDKGDNGPYVDSFLLFARLMDDPKYAASVFGDIAAITQVNRAGETLAKVIERTDWHARLLNGSDYPLPGVMPLYSLEYLVSIGLLPAAVIPVLSEIRLHNPLLFDFVLKRHLRYNGRALAAGVFETRGFFVR